MKNTHFAENRITLPLLSHVWWVMQGHMIGQKATNCSTCAILLYPISLFSATWISRLDLVAVLNLAWYEQVPVYDVTMCVCNDRDTSCEYVSYSPVIRHWFHCEHRLHCGRLPTADIRLEVRRQRADRGDGKWPWESWHSGRVRQSEYRPTRTFDNQECYIGWRWTLGVYRY